MGHRAGVVIAAVAFVAGALALIVWSSLGLSQVTGKICITFKGRTECRTAAGATREEAIVTATQMACSALASGMTERISCGRTAPSSTEWQ